MSDAREDGAAYTLLGGPDCTMNGMFGVYLELLGRAEEMLERGPCACVGAGGGQHQAKCKRGILLADIRRALG